MLKIRFQRIGKRGKAYFRVIVVEHTTRPKGTYLELLGSYDPHSKKLQINKESVYKWMKQGVKLSPTVNNLFVQQGIIQGAKVMSWKPKKKAAKAGAQPTSQASSSTP